MKTFGAILLKFGTIMCLVISPAICKVGFDRNRTIVIFNPRVSLYDDLIVDNMTIKHILPLIEKVSTKFSKIYLNYEPYHHAMIAVVLEATAIFNKLKSNENSSTSIKIWLRFYPFDDATDECSFITNFGENFSEPIPSQGIVNKVQILVSSVNIVFPGTVEAIILSGGFLQTSGAVSMIEYVLAFFANKCQNQTKNGCYKLGVEFDGSICKEIADSNYFEITDILIVREWIHKVDSENFKNCLEHLRLKNTKTEIGFTTGWPDIPDDYFQNSSNVVHYWKSISDWVVRENWIVVFKQAFDFSVHISCNKDVSRGWFRLVENSTYRDSKEYVFESKEESALDELRLRNLTWLQGCTNFSRKLLVPALNPVMVMPTEFGCVGECNSAPLNKILGVVAQEFSSVYVEIAPEYNNFYYRSVDFLKAVQSFNKKMETMQKIRFIINFNSLEDVSFTNPPLPKNLIDLGVMLTDTDLMESIDTLIVEINGVEGLREYMDRIKSRVPSPQSKTRIDDKIAMSIYIGDCLEHDFAETLTAILNYTNTLFIYSGSYQINSGEERYLNLKIFELETCEKRIIEIVPPHKNISFLFGVTSPRPSQSKAGPSGFNGRIAVSSVHLWQGINKWAIQRNARVIMLNAFAEVGTLWQLYRPEEHESINFTYWIKDSRSEAIKWAQTLLPLDEDRSFISWQIVTTAALVIGVLLALSLWCCHRRYKTKVKTGLKGVDELLEGDENAVDIFYRVPYNKEKYEVSLEDVVLDFSEPLGKGEFAEVYKCTVQRPTTESSKENKKILVCAAKLNKSGTSEKARQALRGSISELKILQYLGEHENIILLIGAHTSEMSMGNAYIFLELCELGSLRNYLRFRLPNEAENSSQNCCDQPDMIRWSQEIVDGMEYLASKKVVHTDLATRNVLLTATKKCKISDFGLSRRLQNYLMYQKKSKDPLPWRWMAPESLRLLQFTEKSDVWSFGVTLWEIFSYGALPFPMHNWDANFERHLNEGLRLIDPTTCNETNMYEIMNNCWRLNADDRPDFSELKGMLSYGIHQVVLYVDIAESRKNN